MVRLSDRQQKIVMELSHADAAVTGDALSHILGCSKRTIQSEISKINAVTDGRVIISTNRGYEFDSSNELLFEDGLYAAREETPFSDHALARELLLSDFVPSAGDLAVRLYSSQSSIERALGRLRPLFAAYGLDLKRSDGVLRVLGSPENRKRLLRDMVLEEAQDACSSGYSMLSEELDVSFVSATLRKALDEKGVFIEPGYLEELSINMAATLWLLRSRLSPLDETESVLSTDATELQIAISLCEAYGRRWHLTISNAVVSSLASHLRGFVRFDDEPLEDCADESTFFDDVARIIELAFETYGLPPMNHADLTPLVRHTRELIARSPNGQLHGDEIAFEIQSTYPFVYEVSSLVSHGISERFGIDVSTGELGLLCVHLGFLIGVNDSVRLNVVVVAGPYRDTATIIRDRLIGRFGNKMSIAIANSLQEVPGLMPDMLVTTELTNVLPERTVRVSPLFGSRDLARVEKMSGGIQKHGEKAHRKKICRLIEDELFVHDATGEVLDRTQAIEMLSDRLFERGIVSKEFPSSVMRREEAASTCLDGRFALPHATVMDARRTVVCTLVSDAGIDWDGVTIRLVMLIAVSNTDRSQFASLFDGLAHCLMDKESFYKLVASTTAEEFRRTLYA